MGAAERGEGGDEELEDLKLRRGREKLLENLFQSVLLGFMVCSGVLWCFIGFYGEKLSNPRAPTTF